jgi:hypothetical protein
MRGTFRWDLRRWIPEKLRKVPKLARALNLCRKKNWLAQISGRQPIQKLKFSYAVEAYLDLATACKGSRHRFSLP